jgi:hypothetical protein
MLQGIANHEMKEPSHAYKDLLDAKIAEGGSKI